jgi:hypothetical protein
MGPGSCGYRSKAHDFDPDSEALLTFKTTSTDITHWQPTLVSDEGDHVVIRQASQVDHPPPRLSHGAAVCFYSLRFRSRGGHWQWASRELKFKLRASWGPLRPA